MFFSTFRMYFQLSELNSIQKLLSDSRMEIIFACEVR